MDAQRGSLSMDDYYGMTSGTPSPLDPAWTPAPQLQPQEPFEIAQEPAMSFAAAPAPATTPTVLAAPAATLRAPAPPVAMPAAFVAPTPSVPPAPAPAPFAPTPLAAPGAFVAPPVAPIPSVTPALVPPPSPEPPRVETVLTPAVPGVVGLPVQGAVKPVPPVAATVPAQAGPPAPTSHEELSSVRIGAEDSSQDSNFLNDLLAHVLASVCSDLHLTVGAPPTVRLHGHLTPVEGFPVMTPKVVQKTMYAILTQKQRERFEEELELDFAYSLPGQARFRVNLYKQRDAVGAAFRLIPYEIKRLEELGVSASVANFAMLPRGFVLVTGPTGSGKSTTLAAVVDLANRQRRDHIMTVEDPIEFLHQHQGCLVNQREVGDDTHNFQNALKHVLRQDPDIILVGEMRDLETISVALTAAETGHLVFATLHTQDVAQTIDRVIDVFPPGQQQQVRVQLAGALQGVVCQQLLKTADGKGRAVATEVLVATPAIRNLIREGKTHQIYSALQSGGKFGMSTMDSNLADLVKRGKVTYDAALEKCHHVEDFNRLCGRS